jgi:hypothetical protein
LWRRAGRLRGSGVCRSRIVYLRVMSRVVGIIELVVIGASREGKGGAWEKFQIRCICELIGVYWGARHRNVVTAAKRVEHTKLADGVAGDFQGGRVQSAAAEEEQEEGQGRRERARKDQGVREGEKNHGGLATAKPRE